MDTNQILCDATDYYLASADFNGYPCRDIVTTHVAFPEQVRAVLTKLISDGLISINFGDRHPNLHIRAFADEKIPRQLENLETGDLNQACIYPTNKHLSEVVDPADYENKPYTLELALGCGVLEHRVFELSVLENYRNDPRYHYQNDDIAGYICISDDYLDSEEMQKHDKVLLKSFGFAYDDDMNRAVAVFCGDLKQLTSEHQQIWHSKEVKGTYILHPDFYRTSINGEWGERLPIFTAFIEELKIINDMSKIMERPPLFREDFMRNKPKKFSFLVRPTHDEYNQFVMTLDNMMSGNINKKFFMNEVAAEDDIPRNDGKIEVRPRGTIKMLENWLTSKFRPFDPKAMNEIFETFRKVRKLRQKPAHTTSPDYFDQAYFHSQRDLIIEAYKAIRTIRLVFANHPQVKAADDLDIPKKISEGLIWTY